MGTFHIFVTFIFVIFGGQLNNVKSQLLKPSEWKLSEIGKMNFIQIAAKFGYPGEEKNVITEDGYILKMYHIPGNKTKPVLLIHGNTPSSDCWITRGESSMAITLAKRGYDVWAINLRGNRYSKRHLYLNPVTQAKQFFNFSFHEQAIYDVPASIDLILKETGQESLLAISHSVGTTQLYTLGAEKPEYNEKIKLGISLAPICYLNHVRGLASVGLLFAPVLFPIVDLLNIHELVDHDQVAPLLQTICLGPLGYEICIKLAFNSLVGNDETAIEPDFLPTFFGHYPAGTSVKMLKHLQQISAKKEFTKYDYGSKGNLALYNSTKAPLYDLSKVTMKSALFIGKEDFLGTVKDSEQLRAELPNVVHYEILPYEKFSHIDFIWGQYMEDIFYPYLLPLIDQYV